MRIKSRALKITALILIGIVLIFIGYFAYLYTITPNSIRNPYLQHYHFRMQLIVDGNPVNLGDNKFQTPDSNVSCDLKLPATPIHLHDHKNQFVHVHWDSMTGGLVLKDYGWNYVGGQNKVLGYRFDKLPHIIKVPIFGNELPTPKNGDNFYVYTGSQQTYRQRNFNDFLKLDLEIFFGHPSLVPSSKPVGVLNNLFSGHAYAAELSDSQLTRLNNLIGNVVIFAQKSPPAGNQVKDQFNHLEPLSDSVCGS